MRNILNKKNNHEKKTEIKYAPIKYKDTKKENRDSKKNPVIINNNDLKIHGYIRS